MPVKLVDYYYLEMTDPEQLVPARLERSDLRVLPVTTPCPEFSRFLYATVGHPWYWTDRLEWTHGQWLKYLSRPEMETWVAYLDGNPCGYAELEAQGQRNVQILYFGLLPQFIGQGLGGHLLTVAIERAWSLGASRVWLHTCSLDHTSALSNYLARGFRVYEERSSKRDIPKKMPSLFR
jgi:ribosomal protein S18 acetylase RimI-like enzyme